MKPACATLLTVATILLAMCPHSSIAQTGVTMLSPKAGEIYYAGYVADTIAPWDSMIVEWAYDNDSVPKITQVVIEISPNSGRTWATVLRADKVKISPTKYRCGIDTAGSDISLDNAPMRSLISDSCRVRVYEYNDHSLGGVSGFISIRLGPPPAGVIDHQGRSHRALRPSVDQSALSIRATLSVLNAAPFGAAVYSVNGRRWAQRQGSARFIVRAPAEAWVIDNRDNDGNAAAAGGPLR